MGNKGVGIIGAGNISGIYLQNLGSFPTLDLIGIADIESEKAEAKASQHGIRAFAHPDDLLHDPSIDIVVNLTIPAAHGSVALRAIDAGKHVYNEKPLTESQQESAELSRRAAAASLRVGCAPDTVLGGGVQTCRELIDQGVIGEVISAQAFMLCPGHEGWHPNPEFYYKKGGGPMFDMGPYYLSALVHLLGPVRRVTGSAKTTFLRREIKSQPLAGTVIEVEVPTHITGVLDFHSGAIGHITTSFDSFGTDMPHIDIYGSLGTLRVPDPNGFGGPVLIRKAGESEWSEIQVTRPYTQNMRGLGVLDMALAIGEGRPLRASGEVAAHVLEIMHAVHTASDEGHHVALETKPDRPDPMPKEPFSD